jgi:replicative DNA helicase
MVSICGVDQSGKSNMALTCALNAAAAGHNVGIINLDMEWHLWYLRILSQMGNVRATELLEKDQYEMGDDDKLRAIMEKMQCFPGRLILDDSMPSRISDIERSIDQLRQKDARLIVVDYLQLISPDGKRGSYVEAFDDVVKAIRIAGRETTCAMLNVAQLNRKAKEDESGPHVHHVLGGTALERHGDINIVLDHRYETCGEEAISFWAKIEKNRTVGRLASWKMRLCKKTMEMKELHPHMPT